GRRGAIEERKIGVAVEFGVRGLRHGSLRSKRLTGACQYRTHVLSRPPAVLPHPGQDSHKNPSKSRNKNSRVGVSPACTHPPASLPSPSLGSESRSRSRCS